MGRKPMILDENDHAPLGVLKDPLKGYEDLADVLDPHTGRMINPYDQLGQGMKIEEAAKSAELWWEKTGRAGMADADKGDDYLNDWGTKSGIMNGLPWDQLNRGEKIQVVKIWHTYVGLPRHAMTVNSNEEYENVVRTINENTKGRKFNLPAIFRDFNADPRAKSRVGKKLIEV